MDDPPHPTDQEPDAHKASARRDATIGWAILGVLLAVALITLTTTGFGPYEATAEAARPPTLWDWLGLLIVPLAVAAGAAYISYVQKRTELDIAQKARKEDSEIARQARESEQQIAIDRQRQTTLEAFYDRMTELLLEHRLRHSAEDSEARSIARARVVAVVKGLDGERKGQLLVFLQTSGLIEKDKNIISLWGVDLSELVLPGADLSEVNLSGVDLRGANLRVVYMHGADLSDSDLSGADLRGVRMSKANLRGIDLNRADLRWADLEGGNLSGIDLSGADLSEAHLWSAFLGQANLRGACLRGSYLSGTGLSEADLSRADLSEADLSGTDLSGADLSEAVLSRADLTSADLRGSYLGRADLSEADLSRADLSEADLRDAVGWAIVQFDQVEALESVTMPDGVTLSGDDNPDGPTYDEWKAAYLAKQQPTASQPDTAGAITGLLTNPAR